MKVVKWTMALRLIVSFFVKLVKVEKLAYALEEWRKTKELLDCVKHVTSIQALNDI